MQAKNTTSSFFPVDPLEQLTATSDDEYRRRAVHGIIESYNGNYDMMAEAIQNAVDAVEDAKLTELEPPYLIQVTVDLNENWIGVLDTGVGMPPDDVCAVFAPHISYKHDATLLTKRTKQAPYRGYKGVGLTFIAYGTSDVAIHSKQDGVLLKGRMQYGRDWAEGTRQEPAVIVEDDRESPLEKYARGTYIRVQFSPGTRPRSLSHLGSNALIWETILRTRTAIGQVLLGREPVAPIDVRLVVADSDGNVDSRDLNPTFLYPHEVRRVPAFRFLDLPRYYRTNAERTEPPTDKRRQDGLYLIWDADKIREELTQDQKAGFEEQLAEYDPHLYAFLPYQGSVWGDVNKIATGLTNRTHLQPGLMVAVNRQRAADILDIDPTRFETFSRNVLVMLHFDNARPDQGRKTLQQEVMDFARRAADRAVQYLAKQRGLLRPAGESPTPDQRQIERNHDDWRFNVKTHANKAPLHIPPVAYASTPLEEQDVVGLFHQLSALDVFPGIRVFATSQIKTYDCLVSYDCASDTPGIAFRSVDENPLGVSPFVLGTHDRFTTRDLTLEFKNNLDGLVADLDGQGSKSFAKIDICVCWGKVSSAFEGYHLEEIKASNIDERRYPGITHLLGRDGDAHVVQVIMLQTVTEMIKAGRIVLE